MLDEDDAGQDFNADSAYTGKAQEEVIDKYEMINKVNEKGYRNHPLTEEQKANNREKSKKKLIFRTHFNNINKTYYEEDYCFSRFRLYRT